MSTLVYPRQNTGTYSFASQPKALVHNRKYRDHLTRGYEISPPTKFYHLMYDRRVVRGSTLEHTFPHRGYINPSDSQKHAERKERSSIYRRQKQKLEVDSLPPLPGRLHQDVQTDTYLEALSEKVEEVDVECQTDAFLDRPPTPLYVPWKTGEDKETQLYPGELLDFDLEVQALLQVLIGKTVQQALLEVMEEEELARIRDEQRRFDEIRQAELLELQRLEEKDRRIREEKERRRAEAVAAAEREREIADKVASKVFSHAYLSQLPSQVFALLREHGYFYNSVSRDVEEGFMPWLMNEVMEELDLERRARSILDLLIEEVTKERYESYCSLEEMSKVTPYEKLENQSASSELHRREKSIDALYSPRRDIDGEKTREASYSTRGGIDGEKSMDASYSPRGEIVGDQSIEASYLPRRDSDGEKSIDESHSQSEVQMDRGMASDETEGDDDSDE